MAYIMPLVINALGGGHTDTHIPTRKPKQFQETRHTWPSAACAWCKVRMIGILLLTKTVDVCILGYLLKGELIIAGEIAILFFRNGDFGEIYLVTYQHTV